MARQFVIDVLNSGAVQGVVAGIAAGIFYPLTRWAIESYCKARRNFLDTIATHHERLSRERGGIEAYQESVAPIRAACLSFHPFISPFRKRHFIRLRQFYCDTKHDFHAKPDSKFLTTFAQHMEPDYITTKQVLINTLDELCRIASKVA